jgi:hypothetical protein
VGLVSFPDSGGTASSLNGRVKVRFPAQAGDEAIEVRIRKESRPAYPPTRLSGQPFEILAQGKDSKQNIHKFKAPLTIEVALSAGEPWTTLFTFDDQTRAWLPLPTIADPEAGVLRATTEHLSHFDLAVDHWQAARLPDLDSSQVSAYTGAAATSIPLWTLPGPGGLQSQLALSYHSQAVDEATPSQTQAGWVGMGWSLDVGSIQRVMHGTWDRAASRPTAMGTRSPSCATSRGASCDTPGAIRIPTGGFLGKGTIRSGCTISE